jgi:hypothetical protein
VIQLNTPRNAMLQQWLHGAAFLSAEHTALTRGDVGMQGRSDASVASCFSGPQCGGVVQ